MDASSIINRQFNLQYARTHQLQQPDGSGVTSAGKQKTTTERVLRSFYPGAKAGKSSASVHPITNDHTAPAALDAGKVAEKAPSSPKDDSFHCREPSVSFRQVVIDSAAEKFKFSLVGKFYRSRPSLEQLRKWVLARLRLSGEWSVTLLDRNHVLIKLDNEDDMLRIWPKSRWFVKGYPMKVFKWTPDFRPSDGEPSIAPVWISFPSLPVVYFEQDLLYAIASLLGRVLSMDVPTRILSRTNVARVCVEVDLLQDHPHRVWIGVEKRGFWQAVKYEKLPSYCTHCRQQGHSLDICKTKRSNSIPQKEPLNFVEKAKSMTQQLSAAFQRPHLVIKEEKLECVNFEKHYQTCPSLLEKQSRGNLRISSFTGKLQIKAGKGNGDSEEPDCSYPVQDMECFSASGPKKINNNGLTASSFSDENVSRTKTKLWKTVELLNEGKSLMQEEIKEVEEEDESDDDQQKLGAEDQEVKDAEELVDTEEEKSEKQETANSNVAVGYHQEQTQTTRNSPKLSPQEIYQDNGKKKTLFFWKTRAKQPKDAAMVPNISVKNFTLRELQFATNDFSHKNLVGRGGFGKVYKGRLANGSLVVVKRMKQERTPGLEFQFKIEVEFRGIAVHKNILPLLGFCSVSTERLLVYPYMENRDVGYQLRNGELNLPPLDWPTRKKIALGSAQGLSYMHEQINPKIIHRDVKASNILLNGAFEPLIGDLGLAKAIDINDYVTTAVRGTIGHIPPEYLSTGIASSKTDVYGYGITLLELVTGQRAFDLARLANDDDIMLRDWVKRLLREKGLKNIADPNLKGNYNVAEITMFVNIALHCTRGSPKDRPKMSEVVRMIEG